MHWIYLFLAGFFEIGWPVGLKLAQNPSSRILGIFTAIACMGVSSWLLWLSQKQIPIGTAYAIWTGLGGAGTFIVGIVFFGDPASFYRYMGVAFIVLGVATLKLAH
jgi:quaternary ammonium compound-resistance protein SugE